ncbi:MAG: polyprenyl synthetase family protein [Akkermansia sp.]|nr:polyprenyl synthetase family protein [Akkermansia sp.]
MAIPFFSKLRDKKTHLKLINKELQKVRDEIAAQTEAFEPYVREYMRRICRGQGKMLRPGLVLLTAAATGGIKKEHVTFAALLEMIHMASLIHDDVLDKADVRRDQPTPNALWGNELAVLLGDSLLAQAIVMGAEIGGSKFCRKMAVAMRDLCQGEVEQSSRLWDADMSRADYYELIRKKTATLFAVAMSGAAYLQGMDEEITEQLNRMGTLLGIAYQIYDDCLDLTGTDENAGKTLGTDAEKGKLTLPVFFLMESSCEDVADDVRNRVARHEEIDYTSLRGTEAFREAIQRSVDEALSRNEEAREVLWLLPDTKARKAMAEMTYRLDDLLRDCCTDL